MQTKYLLGLFAVLLVVGSAHGKLGARKMGGLGEERPVDDDIIKIADALQVDVQARLPEVLFNYYTPVSYASQVVAGTNYFIKLDVGIPTTFVLIRVHKDLSGGYTLKGVKTIAPNAPITHF